MPSTSLTSSTLERYSDDAPAGPINGLPYHSGMPISPETSSGLAATRRLFLADLFRPHVRDYESMSLVLDHLGTFCDNALLEIRFNQHQNLGMSSHQMLQHTHARTESLWPLGEHVNLDLREAMSKFDWNALWNATIESRNRIRQYQTDGYIYGGNRRSGSQRWIIVSAACADLEGSRFGIDMLKYLEPIATMQARHSEFTSWVVPRDISGENLSWFSRSFFRHWDQAFQLLEARHQGPTKDDANHILHAFVGQGANVVDVFLKYWYQGSEDASGDSFGLACERAARSAVARQWKTEVDSPFAAPGADPVPLHIRTILGRSDHARSQKTLFSTVSFLAETVERENMHRQLFQLIVQSMKDWAAVTENENWVSDVVDPNDVSEYIPSNEMETESGDEEPWRFFLRTTSYGPLGDRPLNRPPVILLSDLPDDLPDDLPEPTDDLDDESSAPSEDQNIQWEEYTVDLTRSGHVHRFFRRLNPFGTRHRASSLEIVDVVHEACGPRILPNTVSHMCEPPKDDVCPICLDAFGREDATEQPQSRGKAHSNILPRSIHRVKYIRWRQKAVKNEKGEEAMMLDSCKHIFHLECLDQLLNRAYPQTGLVQCPCCRATVCIARPTRVVRFGLDRIPFFRRLLRS